MAGIRSIKAWWQSTKTLLARELLLGDYQKLAIHNEIFKKRKKRKK